MGDEQGWRPDGIRLLAEHTGKWEPELVRIKRMVKHWQAEDRQYKGSEAYREQLQGTAGKQGPLSLIIRTPEKENYSVTCPLPDLRVYKGGEIIVRGNHGLAGQMAGLVRRELWGRQAKRRTPLRGLEQGRGGEAMETLQTVPLSPNDAAMVTILLTDSVSAPARAHLRWGYEGTCGLCGAESGDWTHYAHRCTQTPRLRDKGKMPDCIKYIGHIIARPLRAEAVKEARSANVLSGAFSGEWMIPAMQTAQSTATYKLSPVRKHMRSRGSSR